MLRPAVVIVLGALFLQGCSSDAPQGARPTQTPTPDEAGSHLQAPPDSPPSQAASSAPTTSGAAARKVAVLIAAEMTDLPDLKNDSEFWFDTVLTYCMLRRNGFADADIYVLYGDGTDPALKQSESQAIGMAGLSTRPVPPYYVSGHYCGGTDQPDRIVDFPMTIPSDSGDERYLGCEQDSGGEWHCGPKAILDCLAVGCNAASSFGMDDRDGPKIEPLSSADYLFVWWKGHGNQPDNVASGTAGEINLKIGAGYLSQRKLREWLDAVPAVSRLYVFETCKSGCLGTSLAHDPGSILLTACGCAQQVAWNWDTHDTWHGVFSFWIAGTLGGSLPPGSMNPLHPDTAYALKVDTSFGQSVASAFAQSAQATTTEIGTNAGQRPDKIEAKPATSLSTRLSENPPCPPTKDR